MNIYNVHIKLNKPDRPKKQHNNHASIYKTRRIESLIRPALTNRIPHPEIWKRPNKSKHSSFIFSPVRKGGMRRRARCREEREAGPRGVVGDEKGGGIHPVECRRLVCSAVCPAMHLCKSCHLHWARVHRPVVFGLFDLMYVCMLDRYLFWFEVFLVV